MILAVSSLILFLLLFIFSKKYITLLEMLCTSLFAIMLDFVVDYILEFRYHLYGYFERNKADFSDLIIILGIYPLIDMLFLNYFPYRKKMLHKGFYIVCWSIFAIIYEWLAIKVDLFYYNGWKLIYSVPIYPCLYLILLGNYYLIRHLKKKEANKK